MEAPTNDPLQTPRKDARRWPDRAFLVALGLGVGLAFALPFGCCAAFTIVPRLEAIYQYPRFPKHFSIEEWRSNPLRRDLMARELQKDGTLDNMTREQVRRLLGRPIEAGAWDEWPLGDQPRLDGILTNERLSVHYDKKGRVDQYYVEAETEED